MLLTIQIITLSSVMPVILGFNNTLIDFSIDYFKTSTKFVCLLTCESTEWYHRFAKNASQNNIAVSSVDINKDPSKLNSKQLYNCLKQTSIATGVLINAKCLAFEELMYFASENVFFDSKHKWLIIDDGQVYDKANNSLISNKEIRLISNDTQGFEILIDIFIFNILSNLNLSIDADVTVASSNGLETYNLYEVYSFGKIREGKFVVEEIGNWNSVRGLNITTTFKYYRRWDFQQMAFKMIVVMTRPEEFDPNILLAINPHPSVALIIQTGFQILHEIAGIHNFKYNYTPCDRWFGDYTKRYPYAANNGLYFREQDITPGLRFLPAHFGYYDASFPAVGYLETRFYYKIPSHGIGKYENQFLRPLSTDTWLCVIAMSVLCGIVLLLSAMLEERPIAIHYAIFSVLALICQQFFEDVEDFRRTTTAGKMTVFVTGISCLLIYNYYTSSVVSWLLSGPPPSINSLWELLDSPLQPIFENAGYSYSWLQLSDYYYNKRNAEAEDDLKKRMLNMKKRRVPIIKTINDGINLVKAGGFAYHAEVNGANARIAQTFTKKELCELDSLHSMEKTYLYPCIQTNSPYKKFFVWSLSRLFERGIIFRVQKRILPRAVKCEGSSPRALALGGAAPAFILLAGGFVLATVIMLFERIQWAQKSLKLKNKMSVKKKPTKFKF